MSTKIKTVFYGVGFGRVALLSLIGLWLYPTVSYAIIGETIDDLYKRYGAGKEVGGQMLYKADAYSLTVYFNNKKASMEVYAPMPEVDGTHKPLTDEDVQKILKMEGGGQTWNGVISKTGDKTWVRVDGKVLARLKKGEALVFVDATLK